MIYLASKSPRRSQLLSRLGISFDVIDANVDEQWGQLEPATDYVQRIALLKAKTATHMVNDIRPVLAADTIVVLDGLILGKPVDKKDSLDMLKALSGRDHQVYTAVALVQSTEQILISQNLVGFRQLTSEDCESYCDSGEASDKAGGYGIQSLAACFLTRLEGSYSSVMGLPLHDTSKMLSQSGITTTTL